MFHFIYNPVAGKGKAPQFRGALEARMAALGVEYCFHETRGHGDAADIAGMLTGEGSGLDIVAMGGDGTLSEVLNGIVDPSAVRLGVVPCGNGNDFAAVAGIPRTPDGALDVLLNCEAKPTDFLECGGVRGINAIGTGIDVDILRRYNRMTVLKGSAAYLSSLVLTLFSYVPRQFSEQADGGPIRHNAFIACAGNGQCIGGGIPICPTAVIDDGLMDVVIVDDISRAKIPAAFAKLMKRRILDLPTTTHRRVDRLKITADAPMPIQIDGEIYEDLPFDVRVVSGVLRMFRP